MNRFLFQCKTSIGRTLDGREAFLDFFETHSTKNHDNFFFSECSKKLILRHFFTVLDFKIVFA